MHRYETSILVDQEVSNELPYSEYLPYFAPDFALCTDTAMRVENMNSRTYLDSVRQHVVENLRSLAHAPSVGMHEVPPDMMDLGDGDGDDDDVAMAQAEAEGAHTGGIVGATSSNERVTQQDSDRLRLPDNEYYDDDRDNDKPTETT